MVEEYKRRRDDRWHVGKTVDVGHILTTVGLVAGFAWFVIEGQAETDKRLSLLEQQVQNQEAMRGDIQELKAEIRPLVQKLDSYIEAQRQTDSYQWERINRLDSQ